MTIFAHRFSGKVAVVTGAAQGIGRRVAERMAAEGAQVFAVDRSDIVKGACAEIGANATPVLADLETYAGAVSAIEAVKAAAGRIDILINNVGGAIWMRPFAAFDDRQIEAEIRRSLMPTLWSCHAVLPAMLAHGGGVIVNVSSVATRGLNRVPYAAAKGGVNAITTCLAMEYASKGIRVCGVAPGGTDAPPRLIPRFDGERSAQDEIWSQEVVDQTIATSFMRRYGSADEQAAAILFLASDEASYITGLTLPVAGGDAG